MTDIKNVIDETKDYTLIKSGAGRTLVLVQTNGVIKGKVLCKNFMDLDLDNDKNLNLTLIEQKEINENECPDFLLNKFLNDVGFIVNSTNFTPFSKTNDQPVIKTLLLSHQSLSTFVDRS